MNQVRVAACEVRCITFRWSLRPAYEARHLTHQGQALGDTDHVTFAVRVVVRPQHDVELQERSQSLVARYCTGASDCSKRLDASLLQGVTRLLTLGDNHLAALEPARD